MRTRDASDLSLAFVIDRFSQRGAGTEGQLLRLVNELLNRGVDCRLVALQPTDYLLQQGFPCPWQIVGRDRIADPRTWYALWRCARDLQRRGVRLAHVFFNDASVLAPPAFSVTGMPTLISRRDMGFWYTPSYLRCLRLTRRWIAGCVANSYAVRRYTSEMERIPPEAISVIYNGVEADQSRVEAVPALDALRAEGRVIAVLVANLRPIKRVQDLVEALGFLRASHPALAVAVIGAGDSAGLQARAADLDVADRLVFLGSRDDVGNCLRYADIGVLCSESEGFSNAIVDYMLRDLPVICTDTGGNPEAVENGVTGLLYPVGDVGGLAAALARLADDKALRGRLGENAGKVARTRFAVDRMVAEHIALYRSILRER
ncbi:glycosyltransferase [Methylonatrum kenyense]|uniref:glycosyltransferase n=1 Tax=Methylonatrum kenyense TaxID=455253 RepID=UPI0020BF4B98|nr:glycosyltransferase [Methylonatrum kenyense]MCK8516784.1 glycosyltransferase [Methylonatrum kenyense]